MICSSVCEFWVFDTNLSKLDKNIDLLIVVKVSIIDIDITRILKRDCLAAWTYRCIVNEVDTAVYVDGTQRVSTQYSLI